MCSFIRGSISLSTQFLMPTSKPCLNRWNSSLPLGNKERAGFVRLYVVGQVIVGGRLSFRTGEKHLIKRNCCNFLLIGVQYYLPILRSTNVAEDSIKCMNTLSIKLSTSQYCA